MEVVSRRGKYCEVVANVPILLVGECSAFLASGSDPTVAAGNVLISTMIISVNEQGMLYTLAVLKVPDHTTKRSERTGRVHECIDSLHERIDSRTR